MSDVRATQALGDLYKLFVNLVYESYPSNADGTLVAAHAVAWNWGGWIEMIAVDTITEPFWLVGAKFPSETASSKGLIEVGIGLAPLEVAKFSYPFVYLHEAAFILPIPIPVPANSRVVARHANATGGNGKYLKVLIAKGL